MGYVPYLMSSDQEYMCDGAGRRWALGSEWLGFTVSYMPFGMLLHPADPWPGPGQTEVAVLSRHLLVH